MKLSLSRCQSDSSGGASTSRRRGVGAHAGAPASVRDAGDLRRRPGRDRVHDLLLRRGRLLVDAHVTAEAEHRDPRRGLEDVVQVVRDDHDAEALLGEPIDEREHLLGLRNAERGGRLVEDHELRVPHDGACDRDRLALTARERRDRLADRLDRRHAQARERLARLCLHRRFLEDENRLSSRPRYMFWTTSRLSHSARSW